MALSRDSDAEVQCLAREYQWLLAHGIFPAINELLTILHECRRKMPKLNYGTILPSTPSETYVMYCGALETKCFVTLSGECITQAELNLKLGPKHIVNYRLKPSAMNDQVMRLRQLQDAYDHINVAISSLEELLNEISRVESEDDLTDMLYCLNNCLHRAYTTLVLPPTSYTRREMANMFEPALPSDIDVRFFTQDHRLMLAIATPAAVVGGSSGTSSSQQQSGNDKPQQALQARSYEEFVFETQIVWLNEVLLLLTVAMQVCQQQIHDKIHLLRPWRSSLVAAPRPSSGGVVSTNGDGGGLQSQRSYRKSVNNGLRE